VAVLCWSRLRYIEFSLSQRKADFYRAVVHALEFYSGSPRKIIFDNLKAAVLSGSGRYASLHPEFLALCGHFCMEPIACAARDPESKGGVEKGVGYVKGNALAAIRQALQYQTYDAAYVEAILVQERRRRELPSPTPLQPKRREWMEDIHLEEPDPARYDRLCGDADDTEPSA